MSVWFARLILIVIFGGLIIWGVIADPKTMADLGLILLGIPVFAGVVIGLSYIIVRASGNEW